MRGIYARLLDWLGVAAGAAFALIAVATAYDVLARSAAGVTVKGLADLVEYALFAATFLAAPWLLRQNGHVQVDFIVSSLPASVAAIVRRAADGVGLAVCVILLVYAVRVTYRSWSNHSVVLKTFVFPEWWLYAVVVVSMALLALEFVRRLVLGHTVPAGPPDL